MERSDSRSVISLAARALIILLFAGGGSSARAQAIDVDQILNDYNLNPVNADLHYSGKDLVLKGTVVEITNDRLPTGAVGQAEMSSQNGIHWFCSFNADQILDIAKLRRGDHVELGALLQMRVVRSKDRKSYQPITFDRCSLVSRGEIKQSRQSPTGESAKYTNLHEAGSVANGSAKVVKIDPPPSIEPSTAIDPLTASDSASSVGVGEVYQVGGDVSRPVLLTRVEPAFSAEALREKVQGTVTLSMVINKQGVPTDVHVTKGIGFGLDEQAVAALKQSRFRPAMRNGEPVSVRASYQSTFSCGGCSNGPPDSEPVLVFESMIKPRYPAQRLKVTVWESVTFSVTKEGKTANIVAVENRLQGTTFIPMNFNHEINQNVLEAVSQWRFTPAWRSGVAVDSAQLQEYFRVVMTFDLEGHVGVGNINPVQDPAQR